MKWRLFKNEWGKAGTMARSYTLCDSGQEEKVGKYCRNHAGQRMWTAAQFK